MKFRVLAAALAAFGAFGSAYIASAADPPGMVNPGVILCPNAANTAYVACFGTGSAAISFTTAPASSTGSFAAATITNSSTQTLAAAASRVMLDIKNESTTATIACNFGGAAVLNTAGSYTIPPQWHRSWEGSYVPADAVNCISSAATSPATIEAK